MKQLFTVILVVCALNFSYAQCDTKVREAFGGISSLSLYNTYITIGSIADSYVSEVYDSERVEKLMDEQIAMIAAVNKMLNECRIPKSDGLSSEDVEYIKEIMVCLDYLSLEAEGLKDYAKTKSSTGQQKYSDYRNKAWDMIEDLLGLND
ncbi:MAG TPA: hypothetical protein PLI97_06965 [Fluviicola sp.]|nr:hypothetical protein [Fluviicola sp.]